MNSHKTPRLAKAFAKLRSFEYISKVLAGPLFAGGHISWYCNSLPLGITHPSSYTILIAFIQADFPMDKILAQDSNSVMELLQKSRIVKFDIQVFNFFFSFSK